MLTSKKAGFTLVEFMVVIIVFVVMLAGLYAVLFASEKNWQICSSRTQIQQSLRNAIDFMADELRQSSGSSSVLTISNGANTITFSVPIQTTGSPDSESITLAEKGDYPAEFILLANPDPDSWGINKRLTQAQDVCVSYVLDGNDIIRKVLSAPGGSVTEEFTVAKNIENLQFSRDVPGSDWITIEASAKKYTIKEFPVTYSIITSVHCENRNF